MDIFADWGVINQADNACSNRRVSALLQGKTSPLIPRTAGVSPAYIYRRLHTSSCRQDAGGTITPWKGVARRAGGWKSRTVEAASPPLSSALPPPRSPVPPASRRHTYIAVSTHLLAGKMPAVQFPLGRGWSEGPGDATAPNTVPSGDWGACLSGCIHGAACRGGCRGQAAR